MPLVEKDGKLLLGALASNSQILQLYNERMRAQRLQQKKVPTVRLTGVDIELEEVYQAVQRRGGWDKVA